MKRYVIGIDEAGRGPLAGPVAVGVVAVPPHFDWNILPKVGDSKKVSPKNREAVFRGALTLKKSGMLDFNVILVSAVVIDRIGISAAVARGVTQGLKRLACPPHEVQVKLDGLLKAPSEYTHQETFIKGDAKEKVIGLASIMAKVTRDRYMTTIAEKYPEYAFEIHKGYGTRLHAECIRTYGLSKIHRRSFCKKFVSTQ